MYTSETLRSYDTVTPDCRNGSIQCYASYIDTGRYSVHHATLAMPALLLSLYVVQVVRYDPGNVLEATYVCMDNYWETINAVPTPLLRHPPELMHRHVG